MPFITRIQSKDKSRDGVEVRLIASGFGDPTDPRGPFHDRVRVRAAVASGVIPDFVAHDINAILNYGAGVTIEKVEKVSPGEEMQESIREQFGPVYNAATTAMFTVRVSTTFSR